jgi:hypothetical protein
MAVEGRWRIEDGRLAGGWPDASECPIPVVPCDDAAVERVAMWFHTEWSDCGDDKTPCASCRADALVSWSRFDDLYDDHPKVMAATHSCALAAALHPQAITASQPAGERRARGPVLASRARAREAQAHEALRCSWASLVRRDPGR